MDYDALAKQFGGVETKPENLDALAKQYGGTLVKEPGFLSNVGELLVKGGKQALTSAEVAPAVISGGDVAAKSRVIAEQLATPTANEPRELKEIKGAFKEEGKAWEEAQGFMQSSKAIGEMLYEVGRQAITNPKGLMYMTAEQAANMVPSIVGMLAGGKGGAAVGALGGPGGAAIGAGIGAIGGAFTGQAPVEIGSEFIGLIGKELQKRGLEPTERNVQALMQDKAFVQQAISDARTKGATTAAIDAATTLAGGRFAGGAKNAAIKAARTELGAGADLTQIASRANEIMASRTLAQKVGRGLGGAGIDIAGGGISEAGGQLAAYGKVDLEDVALEMLGELGGAAVEVPLAARSLRTPGLPGALKQPAPTVTPPETTAPLPEPPKDPADRFAELQEKGFGSPERRFTGPDGQPVIIPATQGSFFTPEEKAEYDRLKAQFAPSSESQDVSSMLREVLEQTNEKPAAPTPISDGKPVEPKVTQGPVIPQEVSTFGTEVKQVTRAPFKTPAGFRYSLLESPAYGGEPLSIEDADFELEALEDSAKKGRMTTERFAQSEIGKRLDTAQIMAINDGLRTDPIETINNLRNSLKLEVKPAAPVAAEPANLDAQNAEIVQMYRDAGMDSVADQAANSAKYRNTQAKVDEARQVAVDQIARNNKLQGAIAGTNAPIEPKPRTLADLYYGSDREQDSGQHVPKEVHNLVLNKLNGYINQLAQKGVSPEDIDSRYPQELRDIKSEETALRSQILRYANKLKAVDREYKNANYAQFEEAEKELGNMLGVDLREMRIAEATPQEKLKAATDAELKDALVQIGGSQVSYLPPNLIQAEINRRKKEAPAAPVTPAKPAAVEIVERFPMGENTEYRVVKTQVGYAANLYDADAGKYVPGSARIFKTETFGDQARAKATEFARGEFEKTQPKGALAKPVGRAGYDTEVEVSARALQDAFERDNGESLVSKPEKLEAWRTGTAKTNPVTSPIEVGFNEKGKFGVNDGRHRIALAAERGENVKVMVDKKDVERLKALQSQPEKPKTEADEKAKAKQDLEDALNDLVMLATKSGRMNIVPEDEQELMPILTRLMDAAFRLGKIKFKEAARFVMDIIRSNEKISDKFANQITLDHLQGAYIGMAGKYQDQGASSKKEVIAVESMEGLAEAEEPAGVAQATQFSNKAKMAGEIGGKLSEGASFKTIVEARDQISKMTGQKIEPGTKAAKDADEAIEAGVIIAARNIIEEGRFNKKSTQEIYDDLVDLYSRQPNLSVRSSTSVANQAYSTPAPLAYVASELAGINNKTSVLEPTAGNGMLLIAANPDKVRANELDADRVRMLESIMSGADISQENALEMDIENNAFDVVIANPPFGKAGEISNIDHDIVLKSLVGMKEDGRAVLIVGGVQATTEEGRREGYRGRAKRDFYYELYNLYNVVDHFTAGGNMYAKQGTTYPVDVIVIDGVGKSSRDLPAADLPELITTYEQLKEKLNEPMVSREDRGPAGADVGVSAEREAEPERVGRGVEQPSDVVGAEGREPVGGGERGVSEAGPTGRGQREPSGRGAGEQQPKPANVPKRAAEGEPVAGAGERAKREREAGAEGRGLPKLGGVSVVSGERVQSGLAERRGLETETENQVAYYPHSQASSVGTLVPKAMADSIENSLAKIESSIGDLDNYVAESLDMDPETVRELFSAEQVDAIALAIYNAEAGKGFIIGDQTGVGKGRVVAAMIRYALVHDKIPIFVTEAPNLYSDMIRDLDDIGMTKELGLDTANPKIFITNNGEAIPYTLIRKKGEEITENNLTLKSAKSNVSAMDGLMKAMSQKESLGDYKVIFTTYKQLQTVKGKETERQRFIKQFGAQNYLIFDESHNAGGSGETQARTKEQREKAKAGESLATGRAAFVRNLVQNAYGTFFSSATYAKRPDVMDLYSSTDMSLAVDNISELSEAIKSGGIPMQQTVAQMLTQVGQYIRRERTFAGVAYNTQQTNVNKDTAENMATSMRDILAFSRAKEVVVKSLQKEYDKQGAKLGMEGEKTQVQSANFGSNMHSLIDQMLLSLKVQDSVRHAIERLKANEKVVLTVSNTMGSFLQGYAKEMNLNIGDPVDLSFKDLYIRYLEKQRKVTIKRPNGAKEEYRLTDNDLGPALTQQYNDIKKFIENAGFGSAPMSPIDYMHAELRKAGYKTEEITGRTVTLNYESGRPILTSRSSDIKQRVNAVKAFNSGAADVIILNQAGSTGLSLHASSKNPPAGQLKRHMIIVQAEGNIDTHMQMLGRVHRTGQVTPPAYSQMMADIPAEMRPAAVLLKKMASLNANTTASRKSAVTAEGAVDFMNEYGGQVAQEYLRDNPEVYEALGGKKILEIADDPSEAGEEDIRKLTGYIPVLPIKQQEEVYKDLVERYNDLIEREDSMGSNKLESKAADLDAKTLASVPITEDKGDPSIFAKPAIMEKVDVKRTVKPYSKEEVQRQVQNSLNGEKPSEKSSRMWHDLSDRTKAYGKSIIEKMEAEAEPDRVKIESIKGQINAQYTHIKTVLTEFPIGTPVVAKNSKGMLVKGVVTDIQNKQKTKNPAAGSDWQMTIALADGESKSTSMPFSQIGSVYQLKRETETPWFNQETDKFEYIPMLDLFDKGATVRRENRWMVTGNILAGFAAVNNMGHIRTYTKDDGTTAQGILMPRTFDFEKAQKNADVRLKNLAAVMDFFNTFGRNAEVSTPDGNLRIAYMGGTEYRFVTPSSKREGGSFYLDKGLTDITGDLYKSGQIMRTTVYDQDKANEAIQYLLADRGETLIAYNHKDEAREMFAPKMPLANVQPDVERESLDTTSNFVADRETLIRRYQSLRQKRGSIMRKFKKGEAGLNEQEAINTIDDVASQLKDEIAASKVKRTDAKNFFAQATKQWNEGNISDDVYAAIKTMYEKFPFVLEGLNLSVKQGAEFSDAAGQFFAMARLVRLYKGTTGVQDPVTIRHEITHGLEQMMTADAAADLIMDWSEKLGKAIKKEKSPKAQLYFAAILEFFNNPSIELYNFAMSVMPSYDYYQYINPSEYWAVNAEKLMARKLGTGWDKFVLAAKRLFEGLKYMFGFDNQYVVHRIFNDIMTSKGERFTKAALNDYVEASVMGMLNLDENTRRNYKGKPAPLSVWDSPEKSKMDDWAYRWQDKHVDTKRVVQAVVKGIGEIADRFDAYLKETLYHGRVSKQTMDFLKRDFRPFIEKMGKMGVKVDEFEFYLQNRHAQEYNDLIAARNPGMPDAGSGIPTDDAIAYLNGLSKEEKAKYEELAKDIDKFVEGTQDMLVANGLETQERIDSWRDMFKHYVPLKRDPNELDFVNPSFGMGKGFAIKGDFSRTATGSLKTVVDILNNIALQREMAIVRSEKARVGRALYGMALQAPNPEFWMPINPDAVKNKKKLIAELQAMGLDPDTAENIFQQPRSPSIDKKTGLVQYRINPNVLNAENVFPVRINGKDRFIIFNPADERAKRMVKALKNLDANQLENGLDTVAELTRLIAAMNTQFNPVFGAWNFVRDVESAAVNLTGTPIADKRMEVVAGAIPALKAIYRDLRGKTPKDAEAKEWIDLYERFANAGGQTGYREQFTRAKDKATLVQREMARLDRSNVRRVAQSVADWLSDYNDAMENAVRLSAFKAGLESGLSEDRAAELAKNLTVNFNRKGSWTTNANAFYAFLNASVQGSARMAQLLFKRDDNGKISLTKGGKAVIAGGMMIGAMQAALLAFAGFDADEPPEFLKNKNLIIPNPFGQGYAIIPMPLGLNVFPNVARLVTEYALTQAGAMTGKRDLPKTILSMASAVLDAFNPLGSSGLIQTLSPTLSDPFFAIAENKDAFGRPISKENRATNPSPGWERSRDNASAISQGLAYGINYLTGGGKYGIGAFSPTADDIDYAFSQYVGGLGREVAKAAGFVKAKVEGEETPPYKVPILGKAYGETETPSAVSDKFYKNVTMLAELEGEMKRMREKRENLSEFMKDNPEYRFIQNANNLENQISKINKTIKEIQKRPETEQTKAQIERYKEQKQRMMNNFNERIKALQRQ